VSQATGRRTRGSEAGPPAFADRLLAWWSTHGRHDLPWQHPRTPYRVWVSEIMLQQTQVATVIPYFERWMARFPDLATLARADEDEVLAHWAGLGYYARARNLHRCARALVEEHGGEFPADPGALSALPGIGESTANAIVSQAFDTPLPILDGNAKRVLARHAAIEGWPGRSAVLRALWTAADDRVPGRRGADYTQAIMDLGATICTRTKPACALCPVQQDCAGRRAGLLDVLPGKAPKKSVPTVERFMLLWRDGEGRLLLERRPDSGIWGGLWCLPEAEGSSVFAERFGLDPADFDYQAPVEHRLTHRHLLITPVAVSSHLARQTGEERLAWFAREAWGGLGVPKPVRTILDAL
jgi:A/G-specific adenine glycosylase